MCIKSSHWADCIRNWELLFWYRCVVSAHQVSRSLLLCIPNGCLLLSIVECVVTRKLLHHSLSAFTCRFLAPPWHPLFPKDPELLSAFQLCLRFCSCHPPPLRVDPPRPTMGSIFLYVQHLVVRVHTRRRTCVVLFNKKHQLQLEEWRNILPRANRRPEWSKLLHQSSKIYLHHFFLLNGYIDGGERVVDVFDPSGIICHWHASLLDVA